MSDREELLALRRLAELEAKAGGAAAPQSAAPSRYDARTNEADYQANQAKKGLALFAALPALPLDAIGTTLYNYGAVPVSRMIGKPLQPADPFFYSNIARDALGGAMGVQDVKPGSPEMALRGSIVEMGAAGSPVSAVNAVRGGVSNIARILAQEGAQAIGAGAGAHYGREVGGPGGELVGALAGGVAGGGVAAAGDAATTALRRGMEAVRGNAPKEIRQGIQHNPSAMSNLDRSLQVQGDIERMGGRGYNPTLAARTDSTALKERQRKIQESTPERLDRAKANAAATDAALDTATNTAVGQRSLTPDQLQRIARGSADDAKGAIAGRGAALERQEQGIASRLEGETQQAAGEAIKGRYESLLGSARSVKTDKYDEVYRIADEAKFKTKMDDVVAEVDAIKKSDQNAFQRVPLVGSIAERWGAKAGEEVVKELPRGRIKLQRGGKEAPEVSFQEVHSLWREVNRQIQTAKRSGSTDAPYQTYYLGRIKDVLDKKLKGIEESQGELGAAFRGANKWYREDYAPRFKEGFGGMLGADKRFTDYLQPSDIVAGQGGALSKPEYIDDFKRVFGNDREAMTALQDGILNRFARDTKLDAKGVVDPGKAREFLAKHAEQLDKLPDVKKIIGDSTNAVEAVRAARDRMFTRARKIDQTAVAGLVGASDPVAHIGSQLGKQDRRGLLQIMTIPNKAARETVARVVVDSIPDAASRAGMTPHEYVLRNESLLRPVFNQMSPKHFDNVKTLMEARTIASRADVPAHARVPERVSAIQDTTGMPPNVIWNVLRGIQTRNSSVHGAAALLGSRFVQFLRSNKADALLERAQYDPDLAKTLAQATKGGVDSGLLDRILGQAQSLGVRITANDLRE